ncbi:MAG TPA: hypothetical protein VJZ71_04960 [Phycisphaerae bacterium]|nr:hypothetical protein [Phycisphaerae bacterium]
MRSSPIVLTIPVLLAGLAFGCNGDGHHHHARSSRVVYVSDRDYRSHWRENYRDRREHRRVWDDRRSHHRHGRRDRFDRRW